MTDRGAAYYQPGDARGRQLIFISHAHADHQLAGQLCEALEQVGLPCWIAPRDVTPGQAYAAEIMKGLEASHAVVLVLSAHANESDMVAREIERAVTKNKTVVPLRIGATTASGALEFLVSAQHGIDAPDALDQRCVDQLTRALRKVPGVVVAAPPPPAPRPEIQAEQQPGEAVRPSGATAAAELDRERRAKPGMQERTERQREATPGQEPEARIAQRPGRLRRPLLWLTPLILGGLALVGLLIVRGGLGPAPPSTPAAQEPKATATIGEGPAATAAMVKVPAGEFWMGCRDKADQEKADQECYSGEKPGRSVFVAAFSIDRKEVTVRQYGECVRAGTCTPLETECSGNWGQTGRDEHPINCVDWFQAKAYCEWAGKRLPTEAEWEKAARGTEARIYPWGNDWSSDNANVGGSSTVPVGSYPSGASPYGALDMAGNVWEWVSDSVDDGRGMRGGSWSSYPSYARASLRNSSAPHLRFDGVGFRCAQ